MFNVQWSKDRATWSPAASSDEARDRVLGEWSLNGEQVNDEQVIVITNQGGESEQ